MGVLRGGFARDKGALGVEIRVKADGFTSVITPVCTHLPVDEYNRKPLTAQILKQMAKLSKGSTSPEGDEIPDFNKLTWEPDFDGFIFFGDLNYRFKADESQTGAILDLITRKKYYNLAEYDKWDELTLSK